MKKQYLLVSAAILFSLVACNSPESSSRTPDSQLLKLYDANAKFVTSGYGKDVNDADEWLPLATYRYNKNGEAPYVEVGQFFNVLNLTFHVAIDYESMTSSRLAQYDSYVSKVANHLYGIYTECTLGALIDTEENTINIKRFDKTFIQPDYFNGTLSNDIASPNNGPTSLVHGSIRSKYHGTFKEEIYDLDDYGMEIFELDDKVYLPATLLSNIMLRGLGADFVYNGNDFFISNSVGSAAETAVSGSFRSGNNTFELKGVLYSSVDPVGDEAMRYVGKLPLEEGKEQTYNIFSLDKEGHGYVFEAASAKEASSDDPTRKLDWVKDEKNDVYLTLLDKDIRTGTFQTAGHVMRISNNQTYYNAKSRSKELADFNYQLLRFQIDNFYGLKDELNAKHGFTDFDSFVTEKGLKDKLLSLDTRVYDEGLSQFLMGYIDDGHTKYTDISIFSGIEENTADKLTDRYIGPRRSKLFEDHEKYTKLREEAIGKDNPQTGLFIEDETAVIRFDSFMHILPLISFPGDALIDSMDYETVFAGSTPFGFIKAFKDLENHPEVKNLVLDLTCNGGGMVLTLPFLAACFTKDPTIFLRDNLSGVVREFHYDVDLNHNGVYGDAGDCLADKYHIYLLTSEFSFSCASAFPTMAYIAGADIIGTRCGGGACNVAGFTDACGSIYTLSAPQQIGYLDKDGNFINDDAGIPVTHELASDSWYDMVKLNQAVKGYSAE